MTKGLRAFEFDAQAVEPFLPMFQISDQLLRCDLSFPSKPLVQFFNLAQADATRSRCVTFRGRQRVTQTGEFGAIHICFPHSAQGRAQLLGGFVPAPGSLSDRVGSRRAVELRLEPQRGDAQSMDMFAAGFVAACIQQRAPAFKGQLRQLRSRDADLRVVTNVTGIHRPLISYLSILHHLNGWQSRIMQAFGLCRTLKRLENQAGILLMSAFTRRFRWNRMDWARSSPESSPSSGPNWAALATQSTFRQAS